MLSFFAPKPGRRGPHLPADSALRQAGHRRRHHRPRGGTPLPAGCVGPAGVNPNTVQKAYRLLEEEGLILSHTGAKSTVVADEAAQSRVRGELLQAEVRDTIAAMKHMGLSRQEALALVDQLWKEGETP